VSAELVIGFILAYLLNQKFKATIELFDAASLEPGEIIVSLGSTEDFERIGVERFFFLTDLSFEITYDAAGTAQVLVTSALAKLEAGRPLDRRGERPVDTALG